MHYQILQTEAWCCKKSVTESLRAHVSPTYMVRGLLCSVAKVYLLLHQIKPQEKQPGKDHWVHCLRKLGQLRGCNFITRNILKPLITCTHPISICITTHCCQKRSRYKCPPKPGLHRLLQSQLFVVKISSWICHLLCDLMNERERGKKCWYLTSDTTD